MFIVSASLVLDGQWNELCCASLNSINGWRWSLLSHHSLVYELLSGRAKATKLTLLLLLLCLNCRSIMFLSGRRWQCSSVIPTFKHADFQHHVIKPTIRFAKQFCIFVPFLDVWWSDMGLDNTPDIPDEAFLELFMKCAVWNAAWDRLQIVFLFWNSTFLILLF